MSKQTFDFSEALRRMRQGKKVKRCGNPKISFGIRGDTIRIYPLNREGRVIFQTGLYFDVLHCFDILATDWEEVEG